MKNQEMKQKIIVVLIVVAIISVSILISRNLSVERIEVDATVTKLQHEESHMRFSPATKMLRATPEKYLVTISYGRILETFNDEDLYNRVKKGDSIKMILMNYYLWGKLIDWDLRLPE